jgi:hypothetical protein
VDANGNALTGTLTVTVRLDDAHHLVITAGNTGRLAFDFNLAASNSVNLTAGTVTVTPTLVATVVPSDTKRLRVRGSLVSATPAQNDFVLKVKPFHEETATLGQLTVQVGPTTTYQINGKTYVGTAGITALAGLPADTMVAAFGTLTASASAQTFTASSVLVGTSLENTAEDQISGTVIARNATALTVRGATWSKRDGDFEFESQDVTVTVGPNTVVTEEGQMGTFTAANISVGQRIDVFGMAGTGTGGAMTLDAAAGEVRLELTPAWGLVTAMSPGSLTLKLVSLGGLPASVFNFGGTGSSAANDAKAAAYVVNTGTLSQAGLTVNSPVRVVGFVSGFGMAPPDFTAQTLVNFAGVTDALAVDWGRAGSATALTGLTSASTSLQLNLANVGNLHYIKVGPQIIDLTTLASAPKIVPDATATDVFTIAHAAAYKTNNFSTFTSFVTQLTTDLTATTTVIGVAATGTYDTGTNTFTATRVAVVLNN